MNFAFILDNSFKTIHSSDEWLHLLGWASSLNLAG